MDDLSRTGVCSEDKEASVLREHKAELGIGYGNEKHF